MPSDAIFSASNDGVLPSGPSEKDAEEQKSTATKEDDSVPSEAPAPGSPITKKVAKLPAGLQSVLFQRIMMTTLLYKADNEPKLILPEGLHLGSVGASLNVERLQELGIKAIISAYTAQIGSSAHARMKFEKLSLPVIDNPEYDIKQHFEESSAFIDKHLAAGEHVLVHCFAGKSRSVTLIVAYLMKTKRWSFQRSLEFVRIKRPLAAPNVGFVAALLNYQKQLEEEFGEPLKPYKQGDSLELDS